MSLTKRILIGLTILLLAVIGAAAWMFRSRAEAIPDELPPIDIAEADPSKVVIPGKAGLPDLVLADLRGKTVYLLVGDRESNQARENAGFDRLFNRWVFPDDVVGFNVGDLQGYRALSGMIEGFIDSLRPELRLPLYSDYDGAIVRAFQLPRGHAGVIVLGPDGEVLLRHSGPLPEGEAGDELVARLKKVLRAEEPALVPAPAFKIGALDNAACKDKVCTFVFLSRPVEKSDIPGIKGGFEGDDEATGKQLQDPNVRLAQLVVDSDAKLAAADAKAAKQAPGDTKGESPPRVEAVVVGALADVELTRWTAVAATSEARAAFQIPEDQPALVVVDAAGQLAVRELGLVRMYKFTRIADLLGVDLHRRE